MTDELNSNPVSNPPKYRCNYLGTEVEHRWWKNYRKDGFFVRGNGHFWFEEDALCFSRIMLKTILRIPFDRITRVTTGTWHSGTWFAGRPVVKIDWTDADGAVLTTGIGIGNRETADSLIAELQRYHAHSASD